jgi:hypothetical protein
MIVEIRYDAPVWVQVDTEAGAVTRVQCGDAYAEPTRDDGTPDHSVIEDEDGREVVDTALRARALAIAESGDWPAWGWA